MLEFNGLSQQDDWYQSSLVDLGYLWDLEPSWPYPYAREIPPAEFSYAVGPDYNASYKGTGAIGFFSTRSSQAPFRWDTGFIASSHGLLRRGEIRKPVKPTLHLRVKQKRKPPRLPSLERMTRLERSKALGSWYVRSRKFAQKQQAFDDRNARRLKRYERRLAKYNELMIRYRTQENRRKRLVAGPRFTKRGVRRYAERHPYARFTFSGDVYAKVLDVDSQRDFPLSQTGVYPINQYYYGVFGRQRNPSPLEVAGLSRDPYSTAALLATNFMRSMNLDTRFDDRIRRRVSDKSLNVAVVVGEGRDTVNLGVDLLISLMNLVKGIRRVNPKLLISSVSDLIKMKNLGLEPFIADLRSFFDLISREDLLKVPLVEFRAQTRIAGIAESVTLYPGVQFSGSYRAARTLFYRVENPLLHLASSLGLTSPRLIAWELLPFSFMVDWVVSVGQYLENLSAFEGLTPLDCWDSLRLKGTCFPGAVDGSFSRELYDVNLDAAYYDGIPAHSSVTSSRSIIVAIPQSGSIDLSVRFRADIGDVPLPAVGDALEVGNRLQTFSAFVAGELSKVFDVLSRAPEQTASREMYSRQRSKRSGRRFRAGRGL